MLKKLLIYYSFILTGIMTLFGFLSAHNYQELISATLFFPLTVYFSFLVIPQRKQALKIPHKIKLKPSTKITITRPPLPSPTKSTKLVFPSIHSLHQSRQLSPSLGTNLNLNLTDPGEDPLAIDQDRRKFIKLIGSAGISVFMMSLFTKKAQAAFFGSVPGPGTVSLKDPETGLQISPAIRTPTDGYKISQIDDSTPAYYGFVNKTAEWFIMREDSGGNYRYTKGSSDFQTNWNSRAALSYSTFDVVF